MPRKPSSFFIFTEQGGNQIVGRRVPIVDDSTIEMTVQQEYAGRQNVGTIWVVEDTKATAYAPTMTLEEVDDPRLEQPNP
jgi:hypothetical protein